ncbi:N-acetylneuraminate synthase family protein [Kriegella aquimaris]|uniref:N,N'-diacetyllegionaminate synthase n=1 Tax=Kriegella aquimaris TaxID=192904 RepID=A0A1G9QIP5_9FLAO|nr:N-acetylneuraminate synthase family protein [Kriegella aquimaris]SDM10387.1 N,N'-diacetyllegionaminate synthase [Kriegella aquimaris]
MLPKDTPYLIGETAFHHQGDLTFLKQLIDHGATAKVDAIKFHLLLDLDDYFVKDHEAYDALKEWLFTENEWKEIIDYNEGKGIDSIVLCNDPKAVDFVLDYEGNSIKAIELHATGLNDYLLLEKSAKFNGTVILGVGGSSIDEISYAIDMLNRLGKDDIFLMYGFQNYPTRYEDINLRKMIKLRALFDLPVGYADHTDPANEHNELISTMGLAMGVNVCEKHFTHAIGEKRIDGQAAVSLDQLKKIRTLMDIITTSLGDGNLKMSDGELAYGNTGPMKKAIVAETPIKKGDAITIDNIGFKRTNEGTYMLQQFLPRILGLVANKDIAKDSFIDFSNVDYKFKKANSDQFKANLK